MRTLGLLFILCGLWLCFTILLAWPGAVAIGLGALCYIAGRTTSPSRVARVANVSLGVLIALSITFAAVAFIGLASGVKPSEHTAPAAQMSSQWQKAFATQPQTAKPVKAR